MTKNPISIKKFIQNSIGEWKSLRSTHSLAFQEFENSTSKIVINFIGLNDPKVVALLEKYKLVSDPSIISVSISWQATSDWEEDKKYAKNQTILLFSPKDKNSGIVLRNKGYTESNISSSEYFMDENNNLNIKTLYNTTISEERISFLSTHIRSRFSIVRNFGSNSIIQTSHTSEIRNISILKD